MLERAGVPLLPERTRLVLIEGLPGAGKTTAGRRIESNYPWPHRDVVRYREHSPHPVDVARQAVLSHAEYAVFQEDCRGLACEAGFDDIDLAMDRFSRVVGKHVLVSYFRMAEEWPCLRPLLTGLREKEVCDGRVSLIEHTAITLDLWEAFGREATATDRVHIFEGALLHNPLFDLLGHYHTTADQILERLQATLAPVLDLDPAIVYIEAGDIRQTLERAAKSRAGRGDQWMLGFTRWVEQCPFGQQQGLKGLDGVVAFCKYRRDYEEYLLARIGVPVHRMQRLE